MVTKAVIIDDEEGARESLANILTKYFPEVTILAKADSPKKGMEIILSHRPDLVFLDIEMPSGTAFDLLSSPELENNIDFDVIFITAFDHYAIKAIKFSALDYLLKPIDMDDLREALGRHAMKRKEENRVHEKLSVLLGNMRSGAADEFRKVAVHEMDGLTFIPLKDIVRCESDGNYTLIYTSEGKKILSTKTLSDYDEMLNTENFFRIHRSHLVNLFHLKKYFRGEGYILMSDDSKIEVSRRKRIEFMERVGK